MGIGSNQAPGSMAEALHAASVSLDYLIQEAAELPAAACGQVLTALGGIRAKFTVAHAAVLRRFDALDGHDADGYGTSAAWLAAIGRMSPYAETAACDAMIVPVVTGHADMTVIDRIIGLVLAALDGSWHRHPDTGPRNSDPARSDPAGSTPGASGPGGSGPAGHAAAHDGTAGHGPGGATVTAMTPAPGTRCATPSPGSPSTSSPSPAPAGWPPACAPASSTGPTAPRPCPWTSDIPRRSRPASAAPSSSAAKAAPGPAAAAPSPGATSTTCTTKRTAARPVSVIVFYCVSIIMIFVFTGRAGG